jgi:hypothetical protein
MWFRISWVHTNEIKGSREYSLIIIIIIDMHMHNVTGYKIFSYNYVMLYLSFRVIRYVFIITGITVTRKVCSSLLVT